MPNPFDISSYATPGSSAATGAPDPEVLRRANRAARVAKYGEATVARMEAAGRLGIGATQAARVAPAAAAAPAIPTRFQRLKSIANPNITARGLGKFARAGVIAAPVLGAVESALDTPESVAALGESVGLDPNTPAGRFGANAVNFLSNTGNAATFGVARRVGRMLTGGSFFDPPSAPVSAPAAAAAAPAAAAAAPAAAAAAPVFAPGVSRVTTRAGRAAARAALDGDYTGDLPSGTGFIRNEATGEIREFRDGGARPTSPGAGVTRGGRVAIDASGKRARLDADREIAALAAQGAFLRGEAAFMKAEEGSGGNKTDIIPSLDPTQPPTVVQVKGGTARQLPVIKPLPTGYDEARATAEGLAALKKGANKAKLDAIRAQYGLPPLPSLK